MTIIAATSITGEKMIRHTIEPKISVILFRIILNVFDNGTYRMLITGSPIRSSVYGFVGIILP